MTKNGASLRLAFTALFALAACNSILGNKERPLATDSGPTTCRLNSNCPTDNVCIFQTCGPQCNGDIDCVSGSRCLKTDTGTACVSSSVATCSAGCPAGTTCSPTDGVCRNACDTTHCLSGQTCSAGLCVGTDQHENGSGGTGGMSEGGAGGGGGASETGGASSSSGTSAGGAASGTADCGTAPLGCSEAG